MSNNTWTRREFHRTAGGAALSASIPQAAVTEISAKAAPVAAATASATPLALVAQCVERLAACKAANITYETYKLIFRTRLSELAATPEQIKAAYQSYQESCFDYLKTLTNNTQKIHELMHAGNAAAVYLWDRAQASSYGAHKRTLSCGDYSLDILEPSETRPYYKMDFIRKDKKDYKYEKVTFCKSRYLKFESPILELLPSAWGRKSLFALAEQRQDRLLSNIIMELLTADDKQPLSERTEWIIKMTDSPHPDDTDYNKRGYRRYYAGELRAGRKNTSSRKLFDIYQEKFGKALEDEPEPAQEHKRASCDDWKQATGLDWQPVESSQFITHYETRISPPRLMHSYMWDNVPAVTRAHVIKAAIEQRALKEGEAGAGRVQLQPINTHELLIRIPARIFNNAVYLSAVENELMTPVTKRQEEAYRAAASQYQQAKGYKTGRR